MHLRRFFTDTQVTVGSVAAIEGPDAHHIQSVLRLKAGAAVLLLDSIGGLYEASIKSVAGKRVLVEVVSQKPLQGEAPVNITVAQALLKAKKMDQVLRQLTEMGITRWIPYVAGRSIKKLPSARVENRLQRWNSIAREAVKQCRRGLMPIVDRPINFTNLLDDETPYDLKLLFWEEATASLQMIKRNIAAGPIRHILILIGPEGGLSRQEVTEAQQHGFTIAGMGPRILRAETAALAAVALVQLLWGDLG